MSETPTVALLGAGLMGAGMGKNLARKGFRLRAWNRSPGKLAPLVEAGATACATPAEAARGADVVITMLSDGPAVEAVMTDHDGALGAMDPGATWLQTSTVGVAATERLLALAHARLLSFVDAPVLGTKAPAEAGQLVILASGDDAALARCEPVLSAIGTRTLKLGAAGQGTRVKLVVNAWLVQLLGGLAESFAVARSVGVPEETLLAVIQGGGLDVPYAHLKGKLMLAHLYPVSFPLHLALKDARLVREAATAAGVTLPMMEAVISYFERAAAAGHAADDMAALHEAVGRP